MSDEKKLQQFLGKIIGDFGAAMSVPMVRIGVRLGLYKAMNGVGPMTSAEFARKANISERYAREWLAQNAASSYLTYDPGQPTIRVAAGTSDGIRERRKSVLHGWWI